MNKILVVMMFMFAICVSVKASDIVWGNNTEIYKASGATDLVLDTDTNYFIRLYKSTDSVIDFSIIGNAISLGADTYTGIQFNWNSAGENGFCIDNIFGSDSSYGINAGDKIYSVIFDNSLSSGNCAIIDDSITTVFYSAGTMNYDAGGVNGGLKPGGDWQAIPEPATFLLFGIGGIGAWLIRRKQMDKIED